jgi:ABC-type bacteriocin/lantibiotic exporter with double-glycine peptidase domain
VFRCTTIWLLASAFLVLGQAVRGEESICGARCAHRVLEILNHPVDLTDVIQELYDSPSGGTVSFVELAQVLRRRGISCKVLSVSPFDIPRSPFPIILHVDGNHFVVLEKCDQETAVVWDGLKGTEEVSWWWLRPRCSGAMLVLTPAGEEQQSYTDSTVRYLAITLGTLLILLAIWIGWRLLGWRRAGPSLSLARSVHSHVDRLPRGCS